MECFRLLLEHLAWIEHQFLSGVRDSRRAGSLWGMRGVGGVRKSIHQSWLVKGLGLGWLCYYVLREFRKRFCRKRFALFKSSQWHFHQDNVPLHNSILVTDYLTKLGIKTVRHPPYNPDFAPCDFGLFLKHKGCCYETIEEMKEPVTKDFHGAFQKLLERYNKCIAAREDYFEGDKSFMCVLWIKAPIRKKFWKLIVCTSYIYIYIYIYIYCHPQTDCLIVSQLFSVARHVLHLKLGSKPAQLYFRLSIRTLGQKTYPFS